MLDEKVNKEYLSALNIPYFQFNLKYYFLCHPKINSQNADER